MKKLFQGSNIQNSFLDTVSGIVKQNKPNYLFSSSSSSSSSAATKPSKEKDQYLRLPLESARRLRWYDKGELSKITRQHLREREELVKLNDALRKILVKSGVITEESLDAEVRYQIEEVDCAKATCEGISSVLCIAAEAEIIRLREKLQNFEISEKSLKKSESFSVRSESCTQFSFFEDQQPSISVVFKVDESCKSTFVKVDFALVNKDSQYETSATEVMLSSLITSLQESDLEDKSAISNIKNQIFDVIAMLKPISEMQARLIESQSYTASLEKEIEELRTKRPVTTSAGPLPKVLLKAQDMYAAAEDKVVEAVKRAEKAEIRAAKVEQLYRTETAQLREDLMAAEEKLAKFKEIKLNAINEENKVQKTLEECDLLKKENNKLKEECVFLSKQLQSYKDVTFERDELQRENSNLKDNLLELKVETEKGEYYKRVARDLEKSTATAQEDAYSAVATIARMERKLQDATAEADSQKAKAVRIEDKYKKLKKTYEAEISRKIEMASDDRSNWPQSAQTEIQQLERELQLAHTDLEKHIRLLEGISREKEKLTNENLHMKEQLNETEESCVLREKNCSISVNHLKRELLLVNNEMEECHNVIRGLEEERQKLYTQLHVKYEPMLNFEGCKGGGSFHDSGEMALIGSGFREGLSGIDALYLKNVLFKFIEAVAQGKMMEQNILLPAISTILEASPAEFKQLQDILKSANHGSLIGFSLFKKSN